jgi:transcriptional regulator with XRE-family HTH domain
MQNLADTEKEKIGELIKDILSKLNITQAELAEVVGASSGTIKNILKGKAATFDIVMKTIGFLGIALPITKVTKLPLEPELRHRIKEYHKKYGISDERKLLDKQPTLLIAITDRLIPNGFLKKPKTTGELVDILEEDYNIKTSSSVLSKELQKAVDLGAVIIIDETTKRHQYQQKKSYSRNFNDGNWN